MAESEQSRPKQGEEEKEREEERRSEEEAEEEDGWMCDEICLSAGDEKSLL